MSSEPTVLERESAGRFAETEDPPSCVSSDSHPVTRSPGAESRKRKREEYEMQLFNFHSRAVYATLKSIVMKNIQSKGRKLCKALEDNKSYSENLKINEKQLVRAYYTASSPHLKDIKNIVNKFITVPNNVLADEDKLQRVQYTETEFVDMRKELEEFQQRAKRATVFNAALKEELQLTEQCLIHMDNNDRLIQIIENLIDVIGMAPNVRHKIHELVKNFNQFNSYFNKCLYEKSISQKSLYNEISISQKSLYNTTDDLKCIDYDMDTL